MTIHEARQFGAAKLCAVPDPWIDAELLLGHVVGMKRLMLSINAAQELTQEQERHYLKRLRLRAQREPLQYILGTQCFYGCELRVDPSVLIPRPETETLCEQVLLCMERYRLPSVADICTGSGAIAITLKKNRPDAKVWATELSAGALKTAKANAVRNDAEITFLQGDLLAPLDGLTFDFIVSNPPYIRTEALDTLQPEVLREPRLALDGGRDGLDFYRRLAQDAAKYLNRSGRIFLEFGDGQAEDVAAIFAASRQFEDIHVHPDLYGRQRVLEASRRFP
ncbi:MAG: peptide chain release factor N(5)-glutamine methyltransferase [Bacillota bacterium]